jgi:serine protease Do
MHKLRRAMIAGVLVVMSACGAAAATTSATTTNGTSGAVPLVTTPSSDEPIVQVVAAVTPSVVTVTSQVRTLTPFGGSNGEAVGTGFVVRSDGFILTNQHVIEGASAVTVTLASGKELPATVVAQDATHDLAVLHIAQDGLPALTLGSSDSLAMGESVVAIGYALDLPGGPTVTAGIISSLERSIDVQDAGAVRSYAGLLQTDAALNRGNSGGPLLALDGSVVGVNVAGGDGAENIGFAIPISVADPLLHEAFGRTA